MRWQFETKVNSENTEARLVKVINILEHLHVFDFYSDSILTNKLSKLHLYFLKKIIQFDFCALVS